MLSDILIIERHITSEHLQAESCSPLLLTLEGYIAILIIEHYIKNAYPSRIDFCLYCFLTSNQTLPLTDIINQHMINEHPLSNMCSALSLISNGTLAFALIIIYCITNEYSSLDFCSPPVLTSNRMLQITLNMEHHIVKEHLSPNFYSPLLLTLKQVLVTHSLHRKLH